MTLSDEDHDVAMAISDDDSAASTYSPSIFSGNPSDDSSDSSVEDDSDDDTDGDDSEDEDEDQGEDDCLFEDEVEHPPEYYLAAAENLDVSQLRQERYSPKTRKQLDDTGHFWKRYCRFIHREPTECFHALDEPDEATQFLYGFFLWRCDQRRGKGGRKRPGIKSQSSLETFWKWWHLTYKVEIGHGLDPLAQKKIGDVIAKVAKEKNLRIGPHPKSIMYIEDLAELARVLLTTMEMTFELGWLRIQLLLFCQLAAITGSRPEALLDLRYGDLFLRLVRDPDADHPRLLIELTLSATKRFLGPKHQDPFPIPEIIFDPTLVLSPHIFLLGMLFRRKAFKSENVNGPESLYQLGVLRGLNRQDLPLKDEFLDQYVFCQAIRESDGVRVALDQQLGGGSLRYRLRRGGEITGFEQIMKPYALRYGAAKAFNNSPDVSKELQNVMLQHASIETFITHYSVGIDVDAQAIVRGFSPNHRLIRLARSMSASIDPRRPWKITPEMSRSVDGLPRVMELSRRKIKRKAKRNHLFTDFKKFCQGYCGRPKQKPSHEKRVCPKSCRRYRRADSEYQRADRLLRNEKQRQRNRLKRENLERYAREQPVIDSERQLSGKVVDEEVLQTLQQTGSLAPQHVLLIDAVLTIPETTVEAELARRIRAIHAVIAFCDVEEGPPVPRRPSRRPPPDDEEEGSGPPAKRPRCSVDEEPDRALQNAIKSVVITEPSQRPVICFLCVGNPQLPMSERIKHYKNPGSLTRHFLRKHATPAWTKMVRCNVCNTGLEDKMALMKHAELMHGTVSRSHPSVLGL
ncbi:Putative membrane protein ycf1 [Talaromyces islandicus]|uniref:Putative membrane protein ycf1 n=1 Tax=Talaromyces islandicus TaxID=28573 RepID=A0A0U1MAS6_TALIS|nr:Putative membrane protein ycf1 [Talaromyces islandicus]